jgi:hypothetical protein
LVVARQWSRRELRQVREEATVAPASCVGSRPTLKQHVSVEQNRASAGQPVGGSMRFDLRAPRRCGPGADGLFDTAMSYLVLARKWRPQTFDDITGQEHVTRTLSHAIEQDRVHHAFLFCGARGVGKTSGRAHPGQGPQLRPGPDHQPLRRLPLLHRDRVGSLRRRLRDRRRVQPRHRRDPRAPRGRAYAPSRDRDKIYIIDEVHMLTTEAFNALLKTLEEPPPHVLFIFATTEPTRSPSRSSRAASASTSSASRTAR